MKKLVLGLVCMTVFFMSCVCEENSKPKLYIDTTFRIEEEGVDVLKHSITVVDQDFFETEIHFMPGDKPYLASKQRKPAGFNMEPVLVRITDQLGEPVYFSGTIDFRSYMSARGYELVSERDHSYYADFTFKRLR